MSTTPLSDLSTWTALVVEDEPRLREALVEHLRRASFSWQHILPAGDAEEALTICRDHSVNLAFLDIRLPGISGLELASLLPAGIHIVFVTAYDAHAIEAFEAGAIDYVLKPVTQERIQKTLDRVKDRAPLPVEALRRWLGTLGKPSQAPEPLEFLRWITASSGRRTHLIPVEDVIFFQADSKCTRLECRGASYVITQSIKELAVRLDPGVFQQVHRSTVVNLHAVAWLERHDGEGGTLHLKGHDALIPVSGPFLRFLKDRR